MRRELILLDAVGEVAVITMNRPEKLNAWNDQMREELMDALREVNEHPAWRAAVLTGAGRAFCAGQDLAESVEFTAETAVSLVDQWRELYLVILDLEKPLVAAVNGLAVGAAFTVALLSDLRIGQTGTRFIYAEINAGLPATVGPWLMTQFFGRGRMMDMWLNARPIEAEEALTIGLLTALVADEELLTASVAAASKLAAKPGVAMRLDKRWNRELLLPGLEESFGAARRYVAEAMATGEPQRVMQQFLAKRHAHS